MADHVNFNDLVGLQFSTNPRHHGNDVKGAPSSWAAKHSPTVELFVLTPAVSAAPAPAAPVAPVVASTEKKIADVSENARPTPQPRPRLKAADKMDAHAIIGSRDQSAVELSPKGREFFQKLAGDIEARCALAMAREKIEPVEGMTVQYIIEISTRDGKITVKKLNYPSQVATAAFFVALIEDMSPLEQPDSELSKMFGDLVQVEVKLS